MKLSIFRCECDNPFMPCLSLPFTGAAQMTSGSLRTTNPDPPSLPSLDSCRHLFTWFTCSWSLFTPHELVMRLLQCNRRFSLCLILPSCSYTLQLSSDSRTNLFWFPLIRGCSISKAMLRWWEHIKCTLKHSARRSLPPWSYQFPSSSSLEGTWRALLTQKESVEMKTTCISIRRLDQILQKIACFGPASHWVCNLHPRLACLPTITCPLP